MRDCRTVKACRPPRHPPQLSAACACLQRHTAAASKQTIEDRRCMANRLTRCAALPETASCRKTTLRCLDSHVAIPGLMHFAIILTDTNQFQYFLRKAFEMRRRGSYQNPRPRCDTYAGTYLASPSSRIRGCHSSRVCQLTAACTHARSQSRAGSAHLPSHDLVTGASSFSPLAILPDAGNPADMFQTMYLLPAVPTSVR
ncbi:hypothetical protein EJ03DRAFT_73011 [Teratosphaeria nubilosa]|uniref:Uncharacterized protein n=1 Tax=Teratosphaeria nubilosa TaxID=161662 RepID=A0A6G1LNE6_9PEZI|nr:hypothetical protein EJ03DRAFT_73011 [Teratosphaeria nubilosa]